MIQWYKSWFKHGAFWQTLGRIWGAALVTIAVAVIPLYLWRGNYYADSDVSKWVEDVLMTIIGLIGGFVSLTLIQSRRADILLLSLPEVILDAIDGVVIYSALWIFFGVTILNNYAVALCGHYLSHFLIEMLNIEPERPVYILTALVYALVYFAAMLAGPEVARRRGQRICTGLQNWEA